MGALASGDAARGTQMLRWQGGRLAQIVVAALLSALLLGCAGEGSALLSPSAAGAGGATTDQADSGPYDASSAARPAPFNPFAPEGTTDRPLREVIANPTLADVLKAGALPEFSLGREDAPVVMVKYMSLTCPHCRRFMAETFPTLKREYIDTGKVRLVIREFPIGKTSGNATIALRCAPMGQYLTLYRKFLEQQSAWVSQEVRPDAILRVAAQVGMTRDEYDACVKNRSMIDNLKWVKDRGRELGVIGTPNFFIGNRLVKSVLGMPEIRAIVDPMLAGRGEAAAKAG